MDDQENSPRRQTEIHRFLGGFSAVVGGGAKKESEAAGAAWWVLSERMALYTP
jgi:hypothetical protein